MKIMWWPVLFLVLFILVIPSPYSHAEEQSAGQPESQTDAMDILMNMAGFLSKSQQFSVKISSGYDVVQESGQKIEYGAIRKITVKRPDSMRVDVEQSDGDKNLVVFDGKDITVFSRTQNVYAQASKPGNIDEAIAYFINDLHMQLPLAMLFVNALPAEIESRVQSIDYVEETNILGMPAHHLAAQTETVDFQVWVAANDQPLPLRIVLTYKNEDGQPQFRAQFSDWNLTPKITGAIFAFTPPKGAQKIAFLTQLSQVAAPPGTETSEQTGEQP